jgi:hypothetical protein
MNGVGFLNSTPFLYKKDRNLTYFCSMNKIFGYG